MVNIHDFDEDLCIKYVEHLLRFDETERALLVLDNVPALYREHPTPKLLESRKDILKAITTISDYTEDTHDSALHPDPKGEIEHQLRGRLVRKDVVELNQRGIVPHIIEMGPGNYWLPLALKELGLQFTYKDISLARLARENSIFRLDRTDTAPIGAPILFIAYEIIEHLKPIEILQALHRNSDRDADKVYLSTPLFSYDTRPFGEARGDWRRMGSVGHLRAYTPTEFINVARNLFPTHQWEIHMQQPMCLRGCLANKQAT